MSNIGVTLGFDPEFLLEDEDRVPRAACGRIQFTKNNRGRYHDYTFHVDNVSLELQTPVYDSVTAAINGTVNARAAAIRIASSVGLFVSPQAYQQYSPEELTHPIAWEQGCDPDFEAWAGGKPSVREPLDTDWRQAGGHLHVGAEFLCPKWVFPILMDMALINYMRRVENLEGTSRKGYRAYGNYRPTEYGVEYRTLSNAWLFDLSTASKVIKIANTIGTYLSETPAERIKKFMGRLPMQAFTDRMAEGDYQTIRNQQPLEREIRDLFVAEMKMDAQTMIFSVVNRNIWRSRIRASMVDSQELGVRP